MNLIKLKQLILEGESNPGGALITAEMAHYILDNHLFKDQRKLSAMHTIEVAELIDRNEHVSDQLISFAILGDDFILVNGTHRLNGVVKSKRKQAHFRIDSLRKSTMDQVREWYSTFDTKQKIRNITAISAAYGVYEHTGFGPGLRRDMATAARFLLKGFDYKAIRTQGKHEKYVSNMDIIKAQNKYVGDFVKYVDLIQNNASDKKLRMKLFSPQVLAFGALTIDCKDGDVFWGGVAKDDGLRVGDPRKLYVELVKERKGYNTAAIYQAVHNKFARAWNAYHEGRRLKSFKNIGPNMRVGIVNTLLEDTIYYDEN